MTTVNNRNVSPPSSKDEDSKQKGFFNRPRKGGKSFWDWMDFIVKLAIPLVVVGATIGFGWWQAYLAAGQHEADRQSTLEQQEATILQTYIDNIQDLLLNHNLLRAKPTDDIAILARARTLTALEALPPLVDGEYSLRKGALVKFIYEAHLIGGYNHTTKKLLNSIIDLSGADLTFAELLGATLSGADLTGAILSSAYLADANLYSANLSGATLPNADLHNANLSHAHLDNANLFDVGLRHANLTGATLTNAVLLDATLSGADLTGATLIGADLTGATLIGAIWYGIRLSDAIVTQQQLDQVYSCKNATLPPGLTCHHNQ